MSAGVIADGWEASLARTWPCGDLRPQQGSALGQWRAAWSELVNRCRSGGRVGDLRGDGVDLHGVGASYEILFDDDVLEAEMVVALELRHRGILGGDTLLITDDASEPVTHAPYAFVD